MFDFHTHNVNRSKDSIFCLHVGDVEKYQPDGLLSLGIHPWLTADIDVDAFLIILDEKVKKENVVAVGEIGLDRFKGALIEKQIEIFERQVQIAEKFKLPVIIHCVRTWSEIIKLKKDINPSTPWAIHGFRGNSDLLKQLVQHDFYISYGVPLVEASPALAESLTLTPLNRIFFETDESPVSIDEVYSAASDILNIPVPDLVDQINYNFAEFFGRTRS